MNEFNQSKKQGNLRTWSFLRSANPPGNTFFNIIQVTWVIRTPTFLKKVFAGAHAFSPGAQQQAKPIPIAFNLTGQLGAAQNFIDYPINPTTGGGGVTLTTLIPTNQIQILNQAPDEVLIFKPEEPGLLMYEGTYQALIIVRDGLPATDIVTGSLIVQVK